MSKELIERLRLMSADTYGNDAADALESLEAAYASAVEAGKALAKQAFKAEQERDAIAEELKALREQEPVVIYSGRRLTPENTKEMWGYLVSEYEPRDRSSLYAHPVPARELTNEDIQRIWAEHGLDDCDAEGFARAIERYLKGEGK